MKYTLPALCTAVLARFTTQSRAQGRVYESNPGLPAEQTAHNFTVKTAGADVFVLKIRQDGRVGIRRGDYMDYLVKSQFNVGFGMNSFTADDLVGVADAAAGTAGACIGFNAARQEGGGFYHGTSSTPGGGRNGGSVVWGDTGGGLNFSTIPSGAISVGTSDQHSQHSAVTSTYRRLLIHPEGQVTIGRLLTSNSTHLTDFKLSVEGKIVARSVHVVGSIDWADFVFAPTYRLMPLPELERYLQQHRHLPAIPSAQEVQAQGLDLAAMQAKLLQQIEELTLRVIELDKQNRQLSSQVSRPWPPKGAKSPPKGAMSTLPFLPDS